MGRIRVGALTWEVPEWSESYYPHDLPEEWRLSYYANEFHTAVIDMDSVEHDGILELSEMLTDCHEEFRVILKTGDFRSSRSMIQAMINSIVRLAGDAKSHCIAGIWHYQPASENNTLIPVKDDLQAAQTVADPALLNISLGPDLRDTANQVRQFLEDQSDDSDRYIIATSGFEDIQRLRQLVEIIHLMAA